MQINKIQIKYNFPAISGRAGAASRPAGNACNRLSEAGTYANSEIRWWIGRSGGAGPITATVGALTAVSSRLQQPGGQKKLPGIPDLRSVGIFQKTSPQTKCFWTENLNKATTPDKSGSEFCLGNQKQS